MLHHLSISVSDIEKSSKFYDALLEPLGYSQVCSGKDFVGYGTEKNKDKFALKKRVDEVSGRIIFKQPILKCIGT